MFPRMNITAPLPPYAYCPPQYGAGVGIGAINPMVPYMASPYMSSPVPYPVIGPSPYAVSSMIPCPPGQIGAGIAPWGSPFGLSPHAFAQSAAIHPAMHPAFAGFSPAAFSNQFPGQVACIDPVTGAIIPQPYPAAQSLLPIRPLIAAQPDPVQMAALCGVMPPQAVDPYSVMAQACLTPPLAVNPIQAALRPPIYLSTIGSPQVSVPCTVTAGIPC
jgi:hypothetical protein